MNIVSTSLLRRILTHTRGSTHVLSRALFKQNWINKRRSSTARTPEQMAYIRRLVAPLSPRIQLSEVPGAGVGLVSGKHFNQGQELFSESPHVLAPEYTHHSDICAHCLTPLSTVSQQVTRVTSQPVSDDMSNLEQQLQVLYQGQYATQHAECQHCHVTYCSAACQQAAWSQYHHVLCEGSRTDSSSTSVKARTALADQSRADSMIAFVSRLMAEIALRYDNTLRNNPALLDQSEHVFNHVAEHVLNLMAFKFEHAKQFTENEFFTEQLTLIEQALQEAQASGVLEHVPPISYGRFVLLYLKVNLNYLTAYSLTAPATLLRDHEQLNAQQKQLQTALYRELAQVSSALVEYLQGSGPGLYPTSALLNHCCKPSLNAKFGLKGRVTWTAARDLPPNTPLTIAYVDPTLSRDERNNYLKARHYFSCEGCTECE